MIITNWKSFLSREPDSLTQERAFFFAIIIENIKGQSLEALAKERIFKPLRMHHTSYVWEVEFEHDYAVGHAMNGDTLSFHKRTHANAAGSLETTTGDYSRFLAAVMRSTGLSTTARNEMLSPQVAIYSKQEFPSLNIETTKANRPINLSYGLGWGLFTSAYGRVYFQRRS